ncbi:hypothetical protein ACFZAV_45320 [Streptomyces sp. NPDC008343]|uniref:hypothetical protein n=1 Tax=Streptomyces sp. NPDC008343 TaxID=3364828 RepID=UPI0036E5D8A0
MPWEVARHPYLARLTDGPAVSPESGVRCSRVILVEPAHPAGLTPSETHRLDRVIVTISVTLELATEVPGTLLRDCLDGGGVVR